MHACKSQIMATMETDLVEGRQENKLNHPSKSMMFTDIHEIGCEVIGPFTLTLADS